MDAQPAVIAGAVVASIIGAQYLGRLYRSKVLVPKLTIMDDLPNLGKPREGGKIKGQVVIAGGSVAGLFTAAACCQHFDDVVIVEPESVDNLLTFQAPQECYETADGYLTLKKARPRVGHYDSHHTYQPISPMAMREWFPSFESEIQKLGILLRPANFTLTVEGEAIPFGFDEESPDTPTTFSLTRAGYETLLRRLVVKDCPNVRFAHGLVTGLKTSPEDSKLLTGVSMRYKDQKEDTVEPACLVVDATGNSQCGYHRWLPQINAAIPPSIRESYDPHWVSMAVYITVPPELLPLLPIPGGYKDQSWLVVLTPRERSHDGTYFAAGVVEGGQIMLGPGGRGITPPPYSLVGIREFCANMHNGTCSRWVLDMLDMFIDWEQQEKIKPVIITGKHPKLSLIKYEEAPAGLIPRNFVAIGDSAMVVNPVWGQGISKAILGAGSLDNILRRMHGDASSEISPELLFPKSFSSDFFKLQDNRTRGIWTATKASDYGLPNTTPVVGESLSDYKVRRKLELLFVDLFAADADFNREYFLPIRWFIAPASDYFTPIVIWKLFKTWMTRST